jgi:hypothetical protein
MHVILVGTPHMGRRMSISSRDNKKKAHEPARDDTVNIRVILSINLCSTVGAR